MSVGRGGASASVLDVESADASKGAMAIAVLIRWATTHPTIFSRVVETDEVFGAVRRNKYTFEACRASGDSAGADNVRLMVSSRTLS